MEMYIIMRNKHIIIRIIALLCLLMTNIINSQELNCNSKKCNFDYRDLIVVCNDYVVNYTTIDKYKYMLFVNCITVDSINLFTIVEGNSVEDLFSKKPDCYMFKFNHLIYIYTKDYNQKKDSTWMDRLVNVTCDYYNFPKKYATRWKTDSISYIGTMDLFNYDPVTYEYKVRNGKIFSKRWRERMLW